MEFHSVATPEDWWMNIWINGSTSMHKYRIWHGNKNYHETPVQSLSIHTKSTASLCLKSDPAFNIRLRKRTGDDSPEETTWLKRETLTNLPTLICPNGKTIITFQSKLSLECRVNLSLLLINSHPIKDVWWCGDTAPHIPGLDNRWK